MCIIFTDSSFIANTDFFFGSFTIDRSNDKVEFAYVF